jgi:hypothetical protein
VAIFYSKTLQAQESYPKASTTKEICVRYLDFALLAFSDIDIARKKNQKLKKPLPTIISHLAPNPSQSQPNPHRANRYQQPKSRTVVDPLRERRKRRFTTTI